MSLTNRDYYRRLAQRTLEEMPPEDRFSEEDAALVLRHRELLLGLEERLVQLFYDSLYSHPATRAVFRERERPERERTLREWWRRTLSGPFDQDYWAWQAYVGLAHVRRGVTNPMMLGHAALVARAVGEAVREVEGGALTGAVSRLMATVSALIANGYHEVYLEAASQITGQSRSLLERSVEVALSALEAKAQ
ncbi:protoglobin domain-containing protein [Thermus caliditerrae]|uniref:protoglobin domain-containing protein n=1 Tax=Thermus caliditerrae TaxID=1330700 RepID=UPI00056E90EB|nr:protoglobin domain-containing protein [Thermus caliditerrae]